MQCSAVQQFSFRRPVYRRARAEAPCSALKLRAISSTDFWHPTTSARTRACATHLLWHLPGAAMWLFDKRLNLESEMCQQLSLFNVLHSTFLGPEAVSRGSWGSPVAAMKRALLAYLSWSRCNEGGGVPRSVRNRGKKRYGHYRCVRDR